jgi:outer membrane protein OmpA-like peptidoglycan-associated protein
MPLTKTRDKIRQGGKIMKMLRIFISILFLAGLLFGAGQTVREQVDLASAEAGARIVSFSSNYGSDWDVANLISRSDKWEGELPAWCTESGAPFPHWVVIELAKQTWLTTLIFNNNIPDEQGWEGISAKDLSVEVSTVSAKEGFQKVASFQLERNKNNQLVHLEPSQARWLKIVITSNWGNEEYTELGKLGVFDDGSRPMNIAEELKNKGFVDIYGIYFDFGAAKLKAESGPVLDRIVRYLKDNPAVKLMIEGHTDSVGDAKSNQLLSENRAKAVVEALAGLGVNRAALGASGFGASQPVGDNKTITGRALNRRVTVRVVH